MNLVASAFYDALIAATHHHEAGLGAADAVEAGLFGPGAPDLGEAGRGGVAQHAHDFLPGTGFLSRGGRIGGLAHSGLLQLV